MIRAVGISPATAAASGGGRTWSNVNNILDRDADAAVCGFQGAAQSSQLLLAQAFPASVPRVEDVIGVTITVGARSSLATVPYLVQLYDGSSPLGNTKAETARVSTLSIFSKFGGAGDWWGADPADVRAAIAGGTLSAGISVAASTALSSLMVSWVALSLAGPFGARLDRGAVARGRDRA